MSDFQDIEIGQYNLVGNQSRIVLGTENQYGITYALGDGVIPDLSGYRGILSIYRYIKNRKTTVITFDSEDGEIIMSDGLADPDLANIRIVMGKAKLLAGLPIGNDYYYDLYIQAPDDTQGKYLIEGLAEARPVGSQIPDNS
jgi:hypothetical protein